MRPAVLRFPEINRVLWYRVAAIRHARGMLGPEARRMVRFLSYQRIGRFSGRIIGRRGYDDVDGGMQLAERYSEVHQLADDAFWVDLRRLRRLGLVERVVSPAPGRKAVYALCLRTDAIPQDLPEDLARVLQVWQLPDIEPEPAAEDARYGHLTASTIDMPELGEPVAVELTERQAANLAAAPRWHHPASSPAAPVAASLAQSIRALQLDEDRPDWRCAAIAAPAPGAQVAQWFKAWLASTPETSPLYAMASDPCGSVSTGSWELASSKRMEKPQTTPSAAPAGSAWLPPGDDPRVVARRVMKAAWHAWRRELGHSKVILRSPRSEAAGEVQGDPYADLLRTIVIALPRSSEGELIEVLTGSVASAADVGKVAASRLWRLINSRRTKHEYKRIPHVPEAEHVTWWDEATPDERARKRELSAAPVPPYGTRNPAAEAARTRAAQARAEAERQREEQARQREQAAAKRAAQYARWGINPNPVRDPEQVEAAGEPDAYAEHAARLRQWGIEPAPRRGLTDTERDVISRARTDKSQRRRREMGL